jgi:hypothetical protein
MMKRAHVRRSHIDLALLLCALAGLTACRDSKNDAPPPADASVSLVQAPITPPSESASSASALAAARPPDESETVDAPQDAGPDGAVPRRRRLVAARDAGGAVEPEPPVAAVASAEPPKKRRPGNMGNEQPYGESAASAAPVLQKKPLPEEDPWKGGAPK